MSTTTDQYGRHRALQNFLNDETVTNRIVMLAITITALAACISIGVAISTSRPHISTRLVGTGPDYYGRQPSIESSATRAPVSPYLPLSTGRLNRTLESIAAQAK